MGQMCTIFLANTDLQFCTEFTFEGKINKVQLGLYRMSKNCLLN